MHISIDVANKVSHVHISLDWIRYMHEFLGLCEPISLSKADMTTTGVTHKTCITYYQTDFVQKGKGRSTLNHTCWQKKWDSKLFE